MQALYHVLPMTHVSLTKLQSLLEGEVNQIAARKILDKMVRDGIIEPKGSKRLGIKLSACFVLHLLHEKRVFDIFLTSALNDNLNI